MTTFCWNCASSTLNPYQACPNCSKAVRDMPAPNDFPKWPTYPSASTGRPSAPVSTPTQPSPGWAPASPVAGAGWDIELQRRAAAAHQATEAEPGTVLRVVSAAVIAGVVIGSLGPWVTFGFGSVSGVSGTDGKVALVLGIGAGLSWLPVILGDFHRGWTILGGLLLVLIAGTGVYDWSNLSSLTDDDSAAFFNIGVGWGLVIMTLTAILGIAVAVATVRTESRST